MNFLKNIELIPTRKYHWLVLLSFLYSGLVFSQISFDQLNTEMEKQPKPIVLYINTDHCPYCSIQEKQLEKNKEAKELLQQDFYFLKLNSNTKETITFNQKIYKNNKSGGIHELAYLYANQKGIPSFPTWIIFDNNYQVLFQYHGLLQPKDLLSILKAIK